VTLECNRHAQHTSRASRGDARCELHRVSAPAAHSSARDTIRRPSTRPDRRRGHFFLLESHTFEGNNLPAHLTRTARRRPALLPYRACRPSSELRPSTWVTSAVRWWRRAPCGALPAPAAQPVGGHAAQPHPLAQPSRHPPWHANYLGLVSRRGRRHRGRRCSAHAEHEHSRISPSAGA
jgi:hypothetical protein